METRLRSAGKRATPLPPASEQPLTEGSGVKTRSQKRARGEEVAQHPPEVLPDERRRRKLAHNSTTTAHRPDSAQNSNPTGASTGAPLTAPAGGPSRQQSVAPGDQQPSDAPTAEAGDQQGTMNRQMRQSRGKEARVEAKGEDQGSSEDERQVVLPMFLCMTQGRSDPCQHSGPAVLCSCCHSFCAALMLGGWLLAEQDKATAEAALFGRHSR